MPGICVPVTIDGESYVDGGIVDPLPVDVLREMGVSRIIAVNAIPDARPHPLLPTGRTRTGAVVPRKRVREVVRDLIPLDAHLNYFARGNILEILMRSIHGAQVRMAESLGRQADIVLRPEICDDRWLDFRDPGRFIRPGRQIAERYLDEIKALVTRKAVEHETTMRNSMVKRLPETEVRRWQADRLAESLSAHRGFAVLGALPKSISRTRAKRRFHPHTG